MNALQAIDNLISPLLGSDWIVQHYRWVEETGPKTRRYAVLKPAGGARAGLVRRPEITLTLIGQDGGDVIVVSDAANNIVEAMRERSCDIVFMQPGEPVHVPTADGRPMFEIPVSTITN